MTSVKNIDRDTVQSRGSDTGPWNDASPPLAVAAAGKTDRGRVRDANEDQFLVAELTKLLRVEQTSLPQPGIQAGQLQGHLFLVADGMGGHAGGEVASRIAAEAVEAYLLNSLKWFLRPRGDEGQEIVRYLQKAVFEAEARVLSAAKGHSELTGMGCTLTLALAAGRSLFVAHVGDSRAYLLQGGRLYQLTQDHTLVNELAMRGQLGVRDLAPQLKHVITNAIGGSESGVRVEVTRAALGPGDRLLLCTDGLTDALDDETIADVLKECSDSIRACDRLVDMANDRGGRDNVTAVVVRFDEPLAN